MTHTDALPERLFRLSNLLSSAHGVSMTNTHVSVPVPDAAAMVKAMREAGQILSEHGGGGEVLEAELIALVSGPYNYHHKMDDVAERIARAFDRCRELTIENIRAWCANRRAMLASAPSAPVVDDAMAGLLDAARREFRDSDAAGDVLDWLAERAALSGASAPVDARLAAMQEAIDRAAASVSGPLSPMPTVADIAMRAYDKGHVEVLRKLHADMVDWRNSDKATNLDGWDRQLAALDRAIAALTPPAAAPRVEEMAYTECTRDCDCVGYCKAGLEAARIGTGQRDHVGDANKMVAVPELPMPDFMCGDCTSGEEAFTADQMRAYGEECRRLASGQVPETKLRNALEEIAIVAHSDQSESDLPTVLAWLASVVDPLLAAPSPEKQG